jgi:hypothetical protein
MSKTTEDLLRECGLSHHCEWHTFFTLVNLNAGKDTDAFYQHLRDEWIKLSKGPSGKNLRLVMSGATFGSADVVVVWQAKETDAAKEFAEKVLVADACATHSSNTLPCIRYWLHLAPSHQD